MGGPTRGRSLYEVDNYEVLRMIATLRATVPTAVAQPATSLLPNVLGATATVLKWRPEHGGLPLISRLCFTLLECHLCGEVKAFRGGSF